VPFWLGVPELAAKWNKPTAGARLWFHFDWLALAMQSVENGGLGWQRCHSANAARLATERPSLRLQSIRQHPNQQKNKHNQSRRLSKLTSFKKNQHQQFRAQPCPKCLLGQLAVRPLKISCFCLTF
jgi:hypothetical protein